MAVKVEGTLSVEEMLLNLDTTTKRRVVGGLISKGKELQKLAIKMAPVDEGNLEKAIKMRPELGTSRARDALGRYAKVEIEIYIDMEMPVAGDPKGKLVGDYAYEVHEHLTPMGPKKLGPLSEAKSKSNGGVEVGGGFMTRAADQIELGLDAALAELLRNIL